jgi:hypothetical protein
VITALFLVIVQSPKRLKVSEPSACESNGFPGFSETAPVTSLLEPGCLDGSLGHSNNDFESPGLPSYQHFRPSIRRQDQYPCGFDGIAGLHCCFACAAGIPIDDSAAMHPAKTMHGNGFPILSAETLFRRGNRLKAC